MNLALFDLDHTLIPIDSDHNWGEHTIRMGWVDAAHLRERNNHYYEQYKQGTLDIVEYMRFTTQALRQRSPEEGHQAHVAFMQEVIKPAIRPQALSLVRRHQEAGDLCAIVTATNEFVTRPIAEAFGVPHLIAVELERDAQGQVTGEIKGTPSFREGKITRVQQWLAQMGKSLNDFPRSTFYSDSTNDLPLLEWVTHPVATNPAEALKAIAQQKGWPILELFAPEA